MDLQTLVGVVGQRESAKPGPAPVADDSAASKTTSAARRRRIERGATGAGRGLGRSVALRVAAEGANVIVNDVDPQTAAHTVAEIEARGGTAHPVVADVSLEADVESLVGAAIDRYGCLDLACNNALPEIHLGELSQLDVDDARTLMSVAMLGTPICLKHEITAMEARGGAIVNISSIASVAGQKGTGFYAACKAGIEAMTRVAANEIGRRRIVS